MAQRGFGFEKEFKDKKMPLGMNPMLQSYQTQRVAMGFDQAKGPYGQMVPAQGMPGVRPIDKFNLGGGQQNLASYQQ
jgi:hypothetical protein